jgi:tyrosine-protein kinase Etk/Wzc
MEKEINLWDFFSILFKNKKAIFIHLIFSIIAALIIALLLPKQYKSELVFMPVNSSNNSPLSFLGNNGLLNVNVLGSSKLSKRQYIQILKSRELREKLIHKYNLIYVYKLSKLPNPLDATLKVLDKIVIIKEEEEGGFGITDVLSVSISISDKDPQRAANMGNSLFDLLKEKVSQLNSSENEDIMTFLDKQTIDCNEKLETARLKLHEFQEKYKIYNVPSQVSMVMETISKYEAERIILEKQRAFLLSSFNGNQSELKEINTKLAVLRQKILELEENQKVDILPGLKISLKYSDQYLDLLKETEVYLQISTMLRQQRELAYVHSLRDNSDLYLIDAARPAQYKYKPKRSLVIIEIVFSYMFLVCLTFILIDRLKTFHRTISNKKMIGETDVNQD